MRIKDPFNLLRPAKHPSVDPQNMFPNFLDIDATAKLLRSDGTMVIEFPFRFDPAERTFHAVRSNNLFVPTLPAHFKWKEVSKLEVVLTLSYEITVPEDKFPVAKAKGKGRQKLLQSWNVVYGDNGTSVEPEEAKIIYQEHGGSLDISVEVKPIPSSVEADSGIAKTLLRLSAGGSTQGVGISGGYGPVGVDKPGETSGMKYTVDFEFRVAYLTTFRPAEVIQLPEDLLVHNVRDFPENKADMTRSDLEKLDYQWVKPLRKEAPRLAEAIATGKCPIKLFGYASVTGRNKLYNLEISAKRIKTVEEGIKKAFKPYGKPNENPTFLTFPLGQSTATQSGPSDQERRVEIVIDRAMAKKFLSKP